MKIETTEGDHMMPKNSQYIPLNSESADLCAQAPRLAEHGPRHAATIHKINIELVKLHIGPGTSDARRRRADLTIENLEKQIEAVQ